MNQLTTTSKPKNIIQSTHPSPKKRSSSPEASIRNEGVEQVCFLFRHFDRAGLDAVMTLSNRGALWVQRRPWSPQSVGLERGFVTSRAPLADILEVRARPHRPFQRIATGVAAAVFGALALMSISNPITAMGFGALGVAAGLLAKFWPPVLVIVARAGRFSYRGPWSVSRPTVANVERALRQVVEWSRRHQIPLVGNPKPKPDTSLGQKANPICIEITSFSPAGS